jgi:hypothetical protein
MHDVKIVEARYASTKSGKPIALRPVTKRQRRPGGNGSGGRVSRGRR